MTRTIDPEGKQIPKCHGNTLFNLALFPDGILLIAPMNLFLHGGMVIEQGPGSLAH